MIRIKITQREDGLLRARINGHAYDGQTSDGKVCSAVSTLSFALAQCVLIMQESDQLRQPAEAEVDNGCAFIECIPKDESYSEALDYYKMFTAGVWMLRKKYPQYIKIETDIMPIDESADNK